MYGTADAVELAYLNCLGLSEMVVQAAQERQWARMIQLQQQWQRQIEQCVSLLQQATVGEEAAVRLRHLLEDTRQKRRVLEDVMEALHREHQRALTQLKQTEAYLSPP